MLQLLRIPNLLIVALTQYLLQYLVLAPALREAGLRASLGAFHFFLLVVTTVLLAAGGYVINDILDYKTDLINKPEKMAIGKYISKGMAKVFYGALVLAGAAIAIYLAIYVGNKKLFLIYPAAALLLFLYSRYLKRMPLWGNITVALFCAGVAGIVLFSEREAFSQIRAIQPHQSYKTAFIFTGYITFAFFSTLLREVIKDMEDVDGDRRTGLRTYPVVFGMAAAKYLSHTITLLLLAGMAVGAYWMYWQKEWAGLLYSILFLILPLIILIYFLKKSEIKKHYSTLSQLAKWVMVSGLVLLIILWKF